MGGFFFDWCHIQVYRIAQDSCHAPHLCCSNKTGVAWPGRPLVEPVWPDLSLDNSFEAHPRHLGLLGGVEQCAVICCGDVQVNALLVVAGQQVTLASYLLSFPDEQVISYRVIYDGSPYEGSPTSE